MTLPQRLLAQGSRFTEQSIRSHPSIPGKPSGTERRYFEDVS